MKFVFQGEFYMKILRVVMVVLLGLGFQVNGNENRSNAILENSLRNNTDYDVHVTYKFSGNCAPAEYTVAPKATQVISIELEAPCDDIQSPLFHLVKDGSTVEVPVQKMSNDKPGVWNGYALYTVKDYDGRLVVEQAGYFEKGNPEKTTR